MYRERLRSSAGCVRCKSRRQKCDEKRPRCSFCARHNISCIWSGGLHARSNNGQQMDMVASRPPDTPAKQVARNTDAPCLDPFHVVPLQHSADIAIISDRLQSFFIGITECTLPFDIKETHIELTRGWLSSVHSDEAVCRSFVTYCACFYSERTTRKSRMNSLSLTHESRSLALLRHRIENERIVTKGTLLAAALQFFVATLSVKSVSQLSRIAQGVSALITARGGPSKTMQSVSSSTKQSLIFVDVFNSLLSAQQPFLGKIELPPKPCSYNSLYTGSTIDPDTASCLGEELTDVLKDLHFILFFRSPSQQSRRLFAAESRYLFTLLFKMSYDLCVHQSRLLPRRSLSEIVVYGMILVKEELLLDIVQHPILPITILRRLKLAVRAHQESLHGIHLTVALWACVVALVGTELESERAWAPQFIIETLNARYGQVWPPDWISEFRRELQRVLWHHRIEVRFTTLCARIGNLRSHNNSIVAEWGPTAGDVISASKILSSIPATSLIEAVI